MSTFLESQQQQVPEVLEPRELAASLKVSFYPSTDDYAYIAQRVNSAYKFPARAQYALNAFLLLNMIGLPAVLWYFDQLLAGLAAFIISSLFAIVFLPAILRLDYRQYFSSLFGDIENELAEVELTDEGIWCRHSESSSFNSWKKIKRLEEHKQSIFFFFDHNGIAVAKSGFAYDDEKNRFLTFAKQHVKDFTTV